MIETSATVLGFFETFDIEFEEENVLDFFETHGIVFDENELYYTHILSEWGETQNINDVNSTVNEGTIGDEFDDYDDSYY